MVSVVGEEPLNPVSCPREAKWVKGLWIRVHVEQLLALQDSVVVVKL